MTSTINKPLDGEGSVQVKQDPKVKIGRKAVEQVAIILFIFKFLC